MDGHQVTLATVTVESQTTSHNTKNNNIIIKKDPRFYFPISLWEHLQSNLGGGGKKKRFDCFFSSLFYITCDLFHCNCHKGEKKERLFLHLCALLA